MLDLAWILFVSLTTATSGETEPETTIPAPEGPASEPNPAAPDEATPPAEATPPESAEATPPAEAEATPPAEAAPPAEGEQPGPAEAGPPAEADPTAEPKAATDPFATEPATTEPATDPEPAPTTFTGERAEAYDPEARHQLRDPIDEEEVADPYDRQGFTMSLSVGIAGCRTYDCAAFRIAGSGRLGLGYRGRYLAGGVAASIGGAQYSVPADDDAGTAPADGSLRFVEVGPFVQVFPIARGRIDPFVEFALGFSRYTDKGTVDDGADGSDYKFWFNRPAVRFGVGFPIYVKEHFALGPRFDQTIGFAGKACEQFDGQLDGEDECVSISELVGDESEIDARAIRRSLPRPWSLTLDARFVF